MIDTLNCWSSPPPSLHTSHRAVAPARSAVGMVIAAADVYQTIPPTAITKFSLGLVSFISLWSQKTAQLVWVCRKLICSACISRPEHHWSAGVACACWASVEITVHFTCISLTWLSMRYVCQINFWPLEGHQWLPSVPKHQHQYKAHSSKDNSTDAKEDSKSKGNPRYNTNDSYRWLWHTICKQNNQIYHAHSVKV